jgi:SAM-dependent methyltransferase
MSELKELTSESVSVTEEVRLFYDQYPYPQPIDSLDKYRQLWQDLPRRRADFHLFWPAEPYRDDPSILIAGCGTSQAAKHAMRWPKAHVVGIDVSATSVWHTEDLKRKYSLKNLQVYQLSLERVSDLETSFDQIVSTGVLHHLEDPDAGLRALRSVLKPDGAMHLMVYAPYGRTGVYMLQDFCRRTGIRANDVDIRGLMAALSAMPPGHPLNNLLREASEFRQEAAFADALLHPRDRAYSVPQLFDFIGDAGLTFGRWIRQAPYSVHCGVIANIPQASRIAQLSLAEQFAAVELFRGTMARHSVAVYRSDRPSCSQPINFAGDAWRDYVPIRMPDTVCIEKRLPPAAAAVLINRTHTYRDLLMPIDQTEKCWFDGIDDDRCIGDILEDKSSGSQRKPQIAVARAFFQRLWWYDQVVFDVSR